MNSKTVLVVSLATTSVVSFVAMCYIFFAQRDLQQDFRSKDIPSKPDDTIDIDDNRAPLVVKVESAEDDSRATLASMNNQDNNNNTEIGADSCSRSGIVMRTLSNIKENNIVVPCSSESKPIEGTSRRSCKEDLANNATDGVISTICQAVDADETELSFRLSLTERHCIQPEIEDLAPLGLDYRNRGHRNRTSEEESCSSRRHSETCTSIIISAEDRAMMEELLLQMQEDEELFEFGDEMGGKDYNHNL